VADVELAFIGYFQGLFTSTRSVGMEECLSAVQTRVTPAMNQLFLCPYSSEEVDVALSQMQPSKAPGPDGYGVCFYQKHWSIVGPQVRLAVLNFLNLGVFDSVINYTYIALVHKSANASNVKDFRPIGLCNVLYKVIAKVLANKLKQVLPEIISQQQSAFLPGRLISDNILIANEALHTMATRLTGTKGYMTIKLDMSKAYDRVEWLFLEGILRKLGFAEAWISLIMTCVRSDTYSVLLNGRPTGLITPSRGLR